MKVGKFSGVPLSPPGSSGGKRLCLPRFSPSVSLSRFPWLQESPPASVSSAKGGISSSFMSSEFPETFRSSEAMIGGSKVRPTPQKISRPEVLTFPTFDPQTAGSANPPKLSRRTKKVSALLRNEKSSTTWGFAGRPLERTFCLKQKNAPKHFNNFTYLSYYYLLRFLVGFPRPHVRLRSRLGWPSIPSVYLISLVGYLISRGGSQKMRQSFPPTSAVRSRPEYPPNCSQTLRALPYEGGEYTHVLPPHSGKGEAGEQERGSTMGDLPPHSRGGIYNGG